MMTTLSSAMLARAASRPTATARSRTTVRAAASNGKKAIIRRDADAQQMPTTVVKATQGAGAVFSGVVAAGLAQALAPEPAMAISFTDPVFGDIEVWQFIVLTAGYWLSIEYYLDRKYEDDDKKDVGSIMPKVSESKKSSFAEANAAKEAENAEK